ncbi:MAG: endolytic transglycosylase MltG [Alphaproteobacteria bacterium]|nr:endolytic transglycosylase MltG [Alphaproteobacteria bacterium]MBL0717754.1 endolytic transglycosylase MltG [Alphaproteobacteria bacterium]
MNKPNNKNLSVKSNKTNNVKGKNSANKINKSSKVKRLKLKKISKYQNIKTRIYLCFFISSFILIFSIFFYSPIKNDIEFKVPVNASSIQIANQLKKENIIVSSSVFRGWVALLGESKGLQYGVYVFQKGDSLSDVAYKIFNGKILLHDILIPEGVTNKQVEKIINNTPLLDGEKIIIEQYEGSIWPSTYKVHKGMDRIDFLKMINKAFSKNTNRIKKQYINESKLKWNEVLIMASLIEKETSLDSERKIVASVFFNRLEKGMRLQTDPTVIYAVTNGLSSSFNTKGIVYSNQLKIDSPYNTYKIYGLPPTPISNAGEKSIVAVLQPAKTDLIFFVADGSGGHKFSKTYAQHEEYRKEWRKFRDNKQ